MSAGLTTGLTPGASWQQQQHSTRRRETAVTTQNASHYTHTQFQHTRRQSGSQAVTHSLIHNSLTRVHNLASLLNTLTHRHTSRHGDVTQACPDHPLLTCPTFSSAVPLRMLLLAGGKGWLGLVAHACSRRGAVPLHTHNNCCTAGSDVL